MKAVRQNRCTGFLDNRSNLSKCVWAGTQNVIGGENTKYTHELTAFYKKEDQNINVGSGNHLQPPLSTPYSYTSKSKK